LVLFYDITHDNTDVGLHLLDTVDPNVTHNRDHSLRIASGTLNSSIPYHTLIKDRQATVQNNARLNSFARRNVNTWNYSLPENVVWRQYLRGLLIKKKFSKFLRS